MKNLEKLVSTVLLGATLTVNTPTFSQESVQKPKSTINYVHLGNLCKDFYPSGRNSFFIKIDEFSEDPFIVMSEHIKYSEKISGGFKRDIKLITHYASFIDLTSEKELDNLVKRYKPSISPALTSTIREACGDRYVFEVCRQFMEDGGKIEECTLENFSKVNTPYYHEKINGRYASDPLTLLVRTKFDQTKEDLSEHKKTVILIHEMLHYAFDKLDSVLQCPIDLKDSDSNCPGHPWNTHAVTTLIESRVSFLKNIEDGELLIFNNYSSRFFDGVTAAGYIGVELRKLIDKNDISGIEKFASTPEFFDCMVDNATLDFASREEMLQQSLGTTEKKKKLIKDQKQDLVYFDAYNALIVQQSLRLGACIAQKNRVPFKEAFRQDEFQQKFKQFRKIFSDKIYSNPSLSLYEIAAEEMNGLMQNSRL